MPKWHKNTLKKRTLFYPMEENDYIEKKEKRRREKQTKKTRKASMNAQLSFHNFTLVGEY